MSPFFTPKSIGNLEIRAKALTTTLLDSFVADGHCDFVAQFALAMPIGIFMSMVDLPDSDRLFLLSCAEAIVRGDTEAAQADGFNRAFAYLDRVFTERQATPGTDMLSAMIQARLAEGRPMTRAELLGMGALLLAGGLDTVAGMMSFIMIFLARNPAHRRRLAENPALIPAAVEELMRRHQTANIGRVVVRDMIYQGVDMREGDMILTPTSMAGLDDRRYDNPDQIDFDREDKKSLVFGRGPHQCVGAFLARTELRVFLAEWLRRIPEFDIAPGQTPKVVSGRANSVHALPLVWPVAA